MGAVLSGTAPHGPGRPFGSAYLALSDYMRADIRLAALLGLRVIYVFTRDSVAVGKDRPSTSRWNRSRRRGPSRARMLSARPTPWKSRRSGSACSRHRTGRWPRAEPAGPSGAVLRRRDRDGTRSGGYVRWQGGAGNDPALIATGSEVCPALEAALILEGEGLAARVASMPCVEWSAEVTGRTVTRSFRPRWPHGSPSGPAAVTRGTAGQDPPAGPCRWRTSGSQAPAPGSCGPGASIWRASPAPPGHVTGR